MLHDRLAALAEADRDLHAWSYLDANARETSRADAPLAGLAFGVKDIIDVRGMPTRYGVLDTAPPARVDAWCVAALRAAGAIPIGKTATTAFAWRDPAPTRHPHDARATPGGSSSGSAAAVAASHVPFALGTQTVGSILRPAAYCGVVGYKTTFGAVPVFGVSPLSPSLDTVGLIARDVATVRACASALGIESSMRGISSETPRIAYAANAYAADVSADVAVAIADLARACAAAGSSIDDVQLPDAFFEAFDFIEPLIAYEAYALHEPWLETPLPPMLAALLRRGANEPPAAREDALAFRRSTRAAVEAALRPYDAVMLVVADTAPDRTTTGFGPPPAAATFYGLPALTFPVGRGKTGLPIGVQLVGTCGSDARLLAAARWIERVRKTM